MPDLLVNLLKLAPVRPLLEKLGESGVIVRRARTFEITPVRKFIEINFSLSWADEISVGFARQPVTVYVATLNREVVGFAGYECTSKGFFGPTGVALEARGRGVGKALLLASLWGLRELGYVYGIIGGAGPVEFYQEVAGATVIPESTPGIYTDLLK